MALLFVVAVTGCGTEGDSETNGTLTLTADAPVLSSPYAILTASASVTPVKVGTKVNFTANQFGFNPESGKDEIVESISESVYTDVNGLAQMTTHNFTQRTFDTILQVTAVVGGLSQTKTISVAKLP